jgi:Fungal specific transcription factor domain
MYLGCAIRMATDLNLHHPPVLEGGEAAVTISTIMVVEWQSREILNRTRCWLGCFNSDKAMSTQFGKPTTLREGEYWNRCDGFRTNLAFRLDVPATTEKHNGK